MLKLIVDHHASQADLHLQRGADHSDHHNANYMNLHSKAHGLMKHMGKMESVLRKTRKKILKKKDSSDSHTDTDADEENEGVEASTEKPLTPLEATNVSAPPPAPSPPPKPPSLREVSEAAPKHSLTLAREIQGDMSFKAEDPIDFEKEVTSALVVYSSPLTLSLTGDSAAPPRLSRPCPNRLS